MNNKRAIDCGTTKTVPIIITGDNYEKFLYRYFRGKRGKSVLITEDNVEKLLNTTVDMYTPICCLNDLVCTKCYGLIPG